MDNRNDCLIAHLHVHEPDMSAFVNTDVGSAQRRSRTGDMVGKRAARCCRSVSIRRNLASAIVKSSQLFHAINGQAIAVGQHFAV